MIKELSTMALAAVLTTNITNNFHMVMDGAKSITGAYQTAGQFNDPDSFMTHVKKDQAGLERVANKVATIDLSQEVGPFGVIVAK